VLLQVVIHVCPSGAGLNGHDALGLVEFDDSVHPGHVDHDAAHDGNGTSERGRTRTARDDGDARLGGTPEHARHIGRRSRLDNHVRRGSEHDLLQKPRYLGLVSRVKGHLPASGDDAAPLDG